MNANHTKIRNFVLFLVTLYVTVLSTHAFSQQYDFLKASPVGSWQLREESVINHKGRENIQVIRSSVVGQEEFDGSPHYWLELEMDQFKVKKGKRKKKGKTIVVKTLVSKTELEGHMKSAFNLKNLQEVAKKVIMQNGDQKPMLIEGAGFLADTLLRALGASIDYDFEKMGNEMVEVPAGKFNAVKVEARGDIETKILIKNIEIESDVTIWLSQKVPFGLVKSEGKNLVNGKQQTVKATLLKYGKSGAKTKITREPTVLPGSPFSG